jgi:hypothetical protein
VRAALIAVAILLGSGVIAAAVALKPTGFERCVAIIGGDIDRQATRTGATLDPHDVDVQAARICAGQMQQ